MLLGGRVAARLSRAGRDGTRPRIAGDRDRAAAVHDRGLERDADRRSRPRPPAEPGRRPGRGAPVRRLPGRGHARVAPRGAEVRLDGQMREVRCQIRSISGFSAHADEGELLAWLRNFGGKAGRRASRTVFLVHGDPEAQIAIEPKVRALDLADEDPALAERVTLDCAQPMPPGPGGSHREAAEPRGLLSSPRAPGGCARRVAQRRVSASGGRTPARHAGSCARGTGAPSGATHGAIGSGALTIAGGPGDELRRRARSPGYADAGGRGRRCGRPEDPRRRAHRPDRRRGQARPGRGRHGDPRPGDAPPPARARAAARPQRARVLFPRDVVEAAIASAPSSFSSTTATASRTPTSAATASTSCPARRPEGPRPPDRRDPPGQLDRLRGVRPAGRRPRAHRRTSPRRSRPTTTSRPQVSDAWRLYMVLTNSKKPVVSGAFTEHGVPRMVEMMQLFRARTGPT